MKSQSFRALFFLWLCLSGCGSGADQAAVPTRNDAEILGAGATFPYPLYSKMFALYAREKNVRVNYQAIGSGGGIKQLLNQTVDFGATDAFMKDKDLKKAPATIIHLPICLGAVVVTYNLEGNPEVKLNPETLAGIFLGEIARWNDPKLKALNPGINLPDAFILPVHRSDGSGTTYIFTDYLSKVSPRWKEKVGAEKSVRWLSGLGAKGNPGVAGTISQIPGSIGYVELLYASENKLTMATLQNAKGEFIRPDLTAASNAAQVTLPADTRISLTNSQASGSYPLTSFTWLITYQDLSHGKMSENKARHLYELFWWMTHEGQKHATEMGYAALAPAAVKQTETLLNSLTYNGKKVAEQVAAKHL